MHKRLHLMLAMNALHPCPQRLVFWGMGFFFQWFGSAGWMVAQRDREGVYDGVKTCSSLWDNYKRNSRRLLCFISPLRTPASLCLLACSECLLCVLTPHVMNWGIMDRGWDVRTHDKAHKVSISAVGQPFIHPVFILFVCVGRNHFWRGVSLAWIVMWSHELPSWLGCWQGWSLCPRGGAGLCHISSLVIELTCYCSVQTQRLVAVPRNNLISFFWKLELVVALCFKDQFSLLAGMHYTRILAAY